MKRSCILVSMVIVLAPVLAHGARSAQAACDPALMYETVKVAVLEKEPSTEPEFARVMSSFGLSQDQHVWKCEAESGTMLTAFIGAKRWVTIYYTPSKAEKVPDAILTVLATQGHAEVVGPRAVRFQLRGNEADIATLGSSAVIDEYITVSLAGAIHEDTQCTIKFGAARPKRK